MILFSCDKTDEPMTDESGPAISLLSPTVDQTFTSGDTVEIRATVEDNDELHDVSAILTRTHNGSEVIVWEFDTHTHEQIYTLSYDYVVEVPGMHNDFELVIEANDHNGNLSTNTFSFHVHM